MCSLAKHEVLCQYQREAMATEGSDVQGIPSAWLLADVGRSGLGVCVGRNSSSGGS